MRIIAALSATALLLAGPAIAQSNDWRPVDPENLLVIDSTEGRILIEMVPEAAPRQVERIRLLTRRGFYDGVPFHRVIAGFMAQTGDPTGTGEGGSELSDLVAEFSFRRGDTPAFAPVADTDRDVSRPTGAQLGIFGGLPVQTQPDGQMFATRDGRVDATAWFCTGVVGAARTAQSPDSANSQFFIMTASNMGLNGQYTVWGRVVGPIDPVNMLRVGEGAGGTVPVAERDSMIRVRVAADIPEAERPAARVLDVRSQRFAQMVEERRAATGSRFSVCDAMPPAQIDG